jgi:hypothetical protein
MLTLILRCRQPTQRCDLGIPGILAVCLPSSRDSSKDESGCEKNEKWLVEEEFLQRGKLR